jgi:hypothetical protein
VLYAGAFIVIAIVIVVSVIAFVRSQNRKLSSAESVSRRWQARASAAEHLSLEARAQQAYAIRLASDAVARTGQALEVRQTVERVAEQMNVLMGVVLDQHTDPNQVARHARHALPGEQHHP